MLLHRVGPTVLALVALALPPAAGADPKTAPDFPADAVWLQGGPLKPADLRGRVVDATATGPIGNYQLAGLPTGSYVLLFSPPSMGAGASFLPVYSGGSPTFSGALPIPVSGASTVILDQTLTVGIARYVPLAGFEAIPR